MSEPEEQMDSRFCGNDEVRPKKEPRWTIPFLRALARTGDVRAAAEDAGIDHSTAYARRRSHPEFAGLWLGALGAHARWVELRKAEELRGLVGGPSTTFGGPPPRDELGEDFVGAGSQIKRAGHDRWGPRKERLFFDELAATANVKRSAKAAGVSPNAVYARRLRDAHFRAKWAAVLESGKAAIEMHLVEAANRTFDPDEMDTGEVIPKVSVAEAIRISQRAQTEARIGQGDYAQSLAEQAAAMTPEDVTDLREKILRKLQRMRLRDRPDQIARGWSYDDSWDVDIPPGWVKGPDWRPRGPDDLR